ncbi:hypothetical protein MAPG_08015 [Magnaporthiopsis poae ATCC 64411]|uniref:RRM domain-containing protein n=1 Tax=Magnaporthiopsis poae (strain ATCC 64411 / 73-15) TaxID=644358 RepID=A0A0C4E684_MAGP6|nr:hypothetical protein MAPG_08015 [Magnaporthiopsis poae ATCC 64411]
MGPDNDVATVTVERRYFDTLVRRAQLHVSDVPVSHSLPNDAITVSRADHEALTRTARQYANLRQNLIRGGLEEATIQLLSKDDTAIQDDASSRGPPAQHEENNGSVQARVTPSHGYAANPAMMDRRPHVPSGNGGYASPLGFMAGAQQDLDWSEADGAHEELSLPGDDVLVDRTNALSTGESVPSAGRPTYERQCTRTIQISNLPDGATHADITAVVRGGLLLDIFMRQHDRSATVSFLHAADARAFLDHCKRNDLYIRNKRVEVRWNDRQFILAGHVASKIGSGATRNLVIRRCDPRITEEDLREDLEHIHNLVVIKITFIGNTCYISTNSVHNAMFARTCMMSRFKFKGSKIDWDVDECAQPLDRARPPKPRKETPPVKKPASAIANRFQLLNMDDDEDEDVTPSFAQAKEAVGIIA